jgi:hypothetical protein
VSRWWADRVEANRAIARRIHLDVGRGRWHHHLAARRLADQTGIAVITVDPAYISRWVAQRCSCWTTMRSYDTWPTKQPWFRRR